MPSFEHTKLIKRIADFDSVPTDEHSFLEWLKARKQLDLLIENAHSDEIIMFALGRYAYVHTILVSNDVLSNIAQDDLYNWDGRHCDYVADYTYNLGGGDVWVSRGDSSSFSREHGGVTQIIFEREFNGAKGEDRNYFEINQEYAHLANIHWSSAESAFVKYNELGDIEPIVSVTNYDNDNKISLVTFKREPLELYLASINSSLVRRFDFTLFKKGDFSGWSDNPENNITESENFSYRQKMDGDASYTVGRQIIRGKTPKEHLFADFKGETPQQYVDFIAHDWRNNKIYEISTDPKATTNYFEAENNDLPFELSPAFFKPEVLIKYKNDSDKYTVDENRINCRESWGLRSYDINDARQIHAYICDLRNIPYSEQLYWKSFNEEPKSGISENAFLSDFKGEWRKNVTPLSQVLRTMQKWDDKKVSWWKIKDRNLINQVNTPITSNKDEWAEAFMALAKLIIEGFDIKNIRKKLDDYNIEYTNAERSISLLEKLAEYEGYGKLNGMVTIQLIRTKLKGHANGSEARKIEKEALKKHGSFQNHFEHTCQEILQELNIIESSFLKS